MKKNSQRAQRVGDQIQRELADLLATAVKDPRVGRVTVTHVEVGADLSHATVYFTHLAGKEHAKEAITALSRTAGFLRSALSQRIEAHLQSDGLEQIQHNGMTYRNGLNLPPGEYTVRFVVRDSLGNRTGSVAAPLTVPRNH